jgi:glycosyltransferase involved in cell wall biosynthesis
MTRADTDNGVRARPEEENGKPPVLIAGAFLSKSSGIHFVCEDMASGLSARGWAVTTTSDVKSRGLRVLDMVATTWVKRPRYAVAHLDVFAGSAFVWAEGVGASLRALRCPFVITLRSGALPDFARRWPSRVRRMLEAATVVTSPSSFLAGQFLHLRPDIRVIPNGIHMSRYPDRGITEAKPRLVWVRAYERRYNPVLALEVVRRLVPEFPDIELVMVGPDTADWSAEQTRQEARGLGVDGRVRIRGAVPNTDVPLVLQEGDIFLNTTNVDNAPKTIVEAMACGLCVVSTDAGGVPYLVENDRDALLVPQADPEAMAGAIRRILVEPHTAARLSRNARLSAEARDWDRVLPEWEGLLAEMVTAR